METVLVASPVKNASKWLDRFLGCLNNLGFPKEQTSFAFLAGDDAALTRLQKFKEAHGNVWLRKDVKHVKNRMKKLALLRNKIVNEALKKEDYVFWIDSDIVQVPRNILKVLIEDDFDVVAPYVLIEHRMQFYDTHAFMYKGKNFKHTKPYCAVGNPKVPFKIDSVGSCYLVKRQVYDDRVRYGTDGSEQRSFCREARKKGFKIWVDPRVKVLHANLPMYGSTWH